MKRSFAVTLLLSTLLAGCGGNYQITRTGSGAGTKADFERDERACNQANFFVPESSKNKSDQTIYITSAFVDCMRGKGWNYQLTERKFSLMKSAKPD